MNRLYKYIMSKVKAKKKIAAKSNFRINGNYIVLSGRDVFNEKGDVIGRSYKKGCIILAEL